MACVPSMQITLPSPPSLIELMEEPAYSQRKNLFIQRRKDLKANPNSAIDLQAYQRRDNAHNYTVLKGLVPQALVGQVDVEGGIPYERSDTFFTDFTRRYPANYTLSTTNDSLIIGNRSSHDVRQYSASCNPEYKDNSAAVGMTYMHLMVIPKQKVYNIVAFESTELIEEMINHFKTFWDTPGSIQKSIDRIQLAVDIRAQEVIKSFKKNPETEAKRTAEFRCIMADVQKSTDTFAIKLKALKVEDIVFAFHAAPDASIGHLHMHILSAPSEFRLYSTGVHDWKTIPATAVMEVIRTES